MAQTKKRYIKAENRKWLISYLLLQIIIFALFSGLIGPTFSNANQLLSKLKDPQGFLPLIALPFVIILEGFLKNPIKEFLVFWRIKHRLPGHRAFSQVGPKDARINMEKVRAFFPNGLPADPKQQNNEWFQLYEKYGDEYRVFQSHKAFLLTRDLAALTAAIIPFAIIAHLLARSEIDMIMYHVVFLLGILVVIAISSRFYGERFVANVLLQATLK